VQIWGWFKLEEWVVADKKKEKKSGLGSILSLVLLLIVAAVIAVAIYGFSLDTDYHFERSVVVDADTDEVHAWVGDLRQWDKWGPWREQDPTMKYTYGESTTEVGDKMSWTGDDGSGSLTFTGVDPEKGIEYSFQWEDYDPQPGAIRYEETDDGKVKVTWSMDSKDTPFLMRFIMTHGGDQMNEMFDKGLAKLKQKAEGGTPET
jgi:hypothetical protein